MQEEIAFLIIVVPDGYCFYVVEGNVAIPYSAAISKALTMNVCNGAIAVEAHKVSHALILSEYMKEAHPGKEHNFQMLDPMRLLM